VVLLNITPARKEVPHRPFVAFPRPTGTRVPVRDRQIDLTLGRKEASRVVTDAHQRWHTGRRPTAPLTPTTVSHRIGKILPKQLGSGVLEIPASDWDRVRRVVEGLGATMYLNEPESGERGVFLGHEYEAPCYLFGIEFGDDLEAADIVEAVEPVLSSIIDHNLTSLRQPA